MAKPLQVRVLAESEIYAAETILEDEAELGEDFRLELAATLKRVRGAPKAHTVLLETRSGITIRGSFLKRFSYRIVFFESAEAIVVLALAHRRQRPFYWRGRLR